MVKKKNYGEPSHEGIFIEKKKQCEKSHKMGFTLIWGFSYAIIPYICSVL